MENKFTPGPWEARNTGGAGWAIWADLRPSLGEKFSKDFPITGNDALSAPKVQIAYETWVQFPSEEYDTMQAANITLMAAAPELLEALQQAKLGLEAHVEYARGREDYNMFTAAVFTLEKIDVAIDKATGRNSRFPSEFKR